MFKKRNKTTSSFTNHKPQKQQQQPRRSRPKPVSTLDTRLLVKEAKITEDKVYVAARKFADMPISQGLKNALQKKGFVSPTEIQDKSIDHIMAGRDVLGIAKTGTGKTGAFLIPFIHRWLETKQSFRVLVICPTRELAVQIEDEFKAMTAGTPLKSLCFIGGTNINTDLTKARRPAQLVVATPGRLLDLHQRRAVDFKSFSVLIIDEFDRMLDMGFIPDVKRISAQLAHRDQTLLFSATLNPEQKATINTLLNNPVEVKVSSGQATSDHIDQNIIRVGEGEDKFGLLLKLVKQDDFKKVLIFAETKRGVSMLCKKLNQSNIPTDEIHGNKSQNYRQKALDRFKEGSIRVLVATDVAARGLDISDVSHVINYQLPMTMDSYIHRIGRTGRAGKMGKAYTFVN